MTPAELDTELLLVGGGHAHALVLRRLAMQPRSTATRITLVSPASHTPYSGMLPGMVAGHYGFTDTHIDLARLCQWAGVRFIAAEVCGLDPQQRRVRIAGRPDLRYDVLSLDIGSQPDLDSVPGAREFAVPVKPVASLWGRWRAFTQAPVSGAHRLAVVGGGAGGVELALAMAHALRAQPVEIRLYCGSELLQGYNRISRNAALRALQEAQITLQQGCRVVEVRAQELILDDGEAAAVDTVFWCTAAAPAGWIKDSGLATDARGFLAVNDSLQSVDDPRVFAAGDIATQIHHPRPKAGVYAVRQAPVLAHNLQLALRNPTAMGALRQYRPQKRFLSLVSLGDKRATADRGPFGATGAWVWRWKDHIDRTFMRRFSELPPLGAMAAETSAVPVQMPCGGCGAKLGSDPLHAALTALRGAYPHAVPEEDSDEDVATVDVAGPILQSIDSLRSLVSDPLVMGQITAQHALSDLYAAGAEPDSALAHVVLPYARPAIQQAELEQVLAGAMTVFDQAGCVLRGGHTLQGAELQVGFVVNGRLSAMPRRRKRGGRAGDRLLITKPLGTGVIFAAHMQLAADGRDVMAAIRSMQRSNDAASRIAGEFDATAATDITGFGLVGHLGEMLDDGIGAQVALGSVPLLPGALAAARLGIRSTLWPANQVAAQRQLQPDQRASAAAEMDLLFDPQTSGGLLISVPEAQAEPCLQALLESGHQAAIIGRLCADPAQKIQLQTGAGREG